MDFAVTGYFRLLLFFSSAVSRIAWSAEQICNSEPVRSRDLALESRRTSYCAGAAGAVPSGFSPVRRSWRRSWRPCRRSWRPVRRADLRCIPCVPVAAAGAAAVPVASCASASNGSSADDSVKPNAAPSPSRESAFRREIISVLILTFPSLSLTIVERDWRQVEARSPHCTDDESSIELIARGGARPQIEACCCARNSSLGWRGMKRQAHCIIYK